MRSEEGAILKECNDSVTAPVRRFSRSFPPLLTSWGSSQVTREFWTMMRLNWRIWPLANFFNFALVPVELRVLVTNLVAILWNVFMSRMCASG